MGYTHYFYRKEKLDKQTFTQFANDVQQIFEYVENELHIQLADGYGDPGTRPEADGDRIGFNGSEEQQPGPWTTNEQVSIPWPDSSAGPVATADPAAEKISGTWFAGHTLSQRTAPINNETGRGSGSYETLWIDRVFAEEEQSWKKPDENGMYFECCKTAYRPYDIAVTAVLISLKHHFENDVIVRSDGEGKDWIDGRMVCQQLFGYGLVTQIE